MPYQPSHPYPYNTAINVEEGMQFQFQIDDYDVIESFKIDIIDLLKDEVLYTLERYYKKAGNDNLQKIRITDAERTELYNGDFQIQEGDKSSILPLKTDGITSQVGILNINQYLGSLEMVEKRKYYSSYEDYENLDLGMLEVTLNENNEIESYKLASSYENNTSIEVLAFPYKKEGKLIRGIAKECTCETSSLSVGTLVLPGSYVRIDADAFNPGAGRHSLTITDKIYFNEGISHIGSRSFANHEALQTTNMNIISSITQIESEAFLNCSSLKFTSLPYGLQTVEERVFYKTGVESILIHKNIQVIKDEAFGDCNNLIRVEFEADSVLTEIGTCAFGFEGVPSFSSEETESDFIINLPDTLSMLGAEVFKNNTRLKEIVIPKGLVERGQWIFEGCSNIKKITIPFIGKTQDDNETEDSVLGGLFRSLGQSHDGIYQEYNSQKGQSYDISSKLEEVVLTNTTQIPYGCFMNIDELKISVPNNTIQVINSMAFAFGNYTEGKTPIDFSEFKGISGLREIKEHAFKKAHSAPLFESITYPNFKVKSSAFYQSQLSELVFPRQATIDDYAFAEASIAKITLPIRGHSTFQELWKTSESTQIMTFNSITQIVILEAEDNTIPEGYFQNCYLKDGVLTLPSSITEVGGASFYNAFISSRPDEEEEETRGVTFTLPNELSTIGLDAFNFSENDKIYWYSNKFNYVENGVEKGNFTESDREMLKNLNGSNAEGNAPLYFGNNWEKVFIGNVAMNEDGKVWEYKSTDIITPYESNDTTFAGGTITRSDSEETGYLTYLGCLISQEGQRPNITERGGICGEGLTWTTDENNTSITISGSGDMYDYSEATQVPWSSLLSDIVAITLPSGITRIGNYAFKGAGSLATINCERLDNNLIIGAHAFENCVALTDFFLPGKLSRIEESAFKGCVGMQVQNELAFPWDLYYIGESAFEGIKGITTTGTTIPKMNLTNLNHVENIAEIGNYAFGGWKNKPEIIEFRNKQFGKLGSIFYSSPSTTSTNNGSTTNIKQLINIPGSVKDNSFGKEGTEYSVFLSDLLPASEFRLGNAKVSLSDTVYKSGYFGDLYTHDMSLTIPKGAKMEGNALNGMGTGGTNMLKKLEYDYTEDTYVSVNKLFSPNGASAVYITTLDLQGPFVKFAKNEEKIEQLDNTRIEELYLSDAFAPDCFTAKGKGGYYLYGSGRKGSLKNLYFHSNHNLKELKSYCFQYVPFDNNSGIYIQRVPGMLGHQGFKSFQEWCLDPHQSKIEHVDIYDDGNTRRSFQYACFRGCEALETTLTLREGDSIGRYSFYKCKKMSITPSSNITTWSNEIPDNAFYQCEELQWYNETQPIEILGKVGISAFDGCVKFGEQLIIGDVSVGTQAFTGTNINSITYTGKCEVNNGKTRRKWSDGCLPVPTDGYEKLQLPYVAEDGYGTTTIQRYFPGVAKMRDGLPIQIYRGGARYFHGTHGSGTYDDCSVVPRDAFYLQSENFPIVKFRITPQKNYPEKNWNEKDNGFEGYDKYFKPGEWIEEQPSSFSLLEDSNTTPTFSSISSVSNTPYIFLEQDKQYLWGLSLFSNKYDVYITDNNTYEEKNSYLPTLYIPNHEGLRVNQHITLQGEETYNIKDIQGYKQTGTAYYRQSKGVVSGKLSYYSCISGLLYYDGQKKLWHLEESEEKVFLPCIPENKTQFCVGSKFDTSDIAGTIYREEEEGKDTIKVKLKEGYSSDSFKSGLSIVLQQNIITSGTLPTELINLVQEGTTFTVTGDNRVQTVESIDDNYNITFSPGFSGTSQGYSEIQMTIADQEDKLILPQDLTPNQIVIALKTSGTIRVHGNFGKEVYQGIVDESLFSLIRPGTQFTFESESESSILYEITKIERDTRTIHFTQTGTNQGYVIDDPIDRDIPIYLQEGTYMDIGANIFDSTNLSLTVNYINIYKVKSINHYPASSEQPSPDYGLQKGEKLYLIECKEPITPTNFEVANRELEKPAILERNSVILSIETTDYETTPTLLVQGDTYYQVSTNLIQSPNYYFETLSTKNTQCLYNGQLLSEQESTTITGASALFEATTEYNLEFYTWELQEYYEEASAFITMDKTTNKYTGAIRYETFIFEDDKQYRLKLTIHTKEGYEKSYLYELTTKFISLKIYNNNSGVIEKDCERVAIKINLKDLRFTFDDIEYALCPHSEAQAAGKMIGYYVIRKTVKRDNHYSTSNPKYTSDFNPAEDIKKIAYIDTFDYDIVYDYGFQREETYKYYIAPVFDGLREQTGPVRAGMFEIGETPSEGYRYNSKIICVFGTTTDFADHVLHDKAPYSYLIDDRGFMRWYFKYNTEANSITINTDKSTYDTIAPYPTINQSQRNYKTGTITAFLGGYDTWNPVQSEWTYKDSVYMQDKLQQFANNGKVKFIRDEIGNVLPVDIKVTSFSYNALTNPSSIIVTFEYTQIADEQISSIYGKQKYLPSKYIR